MSASAADDGTLAHSERVAARLRAAGDEEAAALIERLARERESMRRQLVRLGFDLHDGPLQSLAAAAADLRHFQSQLQTFVHEQPDSHKLLGRVDDLVAREIMLGEQIRGLILGTDVDPATERPLTQTLADMHESFSGFTVELRVVASIDELDLSASQRITLMRVVRAALDNVERHSGASEAIILVRPLADGGIEAVVTDNGRGFDPVSASAAGSIGLTAMRERVRLLGGQFSVESEPGGPTSVHVCLPPWKGVVTS